MPPGTDDASGQSGYIDAMQEYLDIVDDEDEMEESLEALNWADLQEGASLLILENWIIFRRNTSILPLSRVLALRSSRFKKS
jgi:hypothetical protein